MYYILNETEMRLLETEGCALLPAWDEKNVSLASLDDKTKCLHQQGFFTTQECTNFDENLFTIHVFQRNI